MKFLFVIIPALIATAFAEDALLTGAALCSNPCLQPVLTNGVGGCQPMQLDCLCGDTQFYTQVSQCLDKECSADDIKQTLDAAYKLCSSLGVSIPTTVVPPATGSSTPTETANPTEKTTSTSHTTSSPTPTSTGAATHFATNGLGVAGAAFVAYLFL